MKQKLQFKLTLQYLIQRQDLKNEGTDSILLFKRYKSMDITKSKIQNENRWRNINFKRITTEQQKY